MNIHSLFYEGEYGFTMAISRKNLISRRTVVKTSALGAVFLFLSTWKCKPSTNQVITSRGINCHFLDSDAQEIFAHLSEALIFHFLPSEAIEKEKVINEVILGIDSYLNSLPIHTQEEILEAIHFLNLRFVRWYLFGSGSHWELTDRTVVIKTLNQWKMSYISLFRSLFFFLQSMITIGYFDSSYSWKHVGYPGPEHALGLRHG
ncbi:hypothetical protein ND861_03160 [Leptospira sp. 2 VSF19]|uniref:Uncharacterized protein n=1 Tax=Leptospira soteropolitanensis TaxID=2950025 RepID=A0AAW5VFN1_9LEPT|nr:hypothetical protein [Leptospira soteropolitanensis]MCW7491646.1 hypothetical protein [Leptospira soteropolitanensis]MCW7499230.1 hypothetical protein [Leptospira soteropolitanensis]MCW7521178.1 hypothetical protein [Leptospira soteropolitanensis]MCW7525334.1 hypothetical protein [Leptospira soteropolitanensis]MCW7529201.1 hypothetical protein [Leptospira soteropolitanensis]